VVTADPEIKCYMPGVPRATYMPYPFQIFQSPQYILMAYEFAGASRTIYMNSKQKSPGDTWMGWSVRPLGGGYAGRRRDEFTTTRLVRQGREFS